MRYSHDKFASLVEQTVKKINELSTLKGGEYAGDDDRLANFRRNGAALNLPMEVIWHTYTAKHWDAVTQYIKDRLEGKTRPRLEALSGRLDDIIVYCILFKAMLEEREKTDNECVGPDGKPFSASRPSSISWMQGYRAGQRDAFEGKHSPANPLGEPYENIANQFREKAPWDKIDKRTGRPLNAVEKSLGRNN
jgi:hypothetical protein